MSTVFLSKKNYSMKSKKLQRIFSKGFTLIELSVVLVIVGLLVTGIISGAKLIDVAKSTSIIKDRKIISDAINIFKSTYSGFPGDIMSPSSITNEQNMAMLPNDFSAGNNDNKIVWGCSTVGCSVNESLNAWVQLTLSGILISPANVPVINQNTSLTNASTTGAAKNVFASGINSLAGFSIFFVNNHSDVVKYPYLQAKYHNLVLGKPSSVVPSYLSNILDTALTGGRMTNGCIVSETVALSLDAKVDDTVLTTGLVRFSNAVDDTNTSNGVEPCVAGDDSKGVLSFAIIS